MRTRRDICTTVTTISDIENIAFGIAQLSNQIINPSILNASRVIKLGSAMKISFESHGGRTHFAGLFEAFRAFFAKLASAIRSQQGKPMTRNAECRCTYEEKDRVQYYIVQWKFLRPQDTAQCSHREQQKAKLSPTSSCSTRRVSMQEVAGVRTNDRTAHFSRTHHTRSQIPPRTASCYKTKQGTEASRA